MSLGLFTKGWLEYIKINYLPSSGTVDVEMDDTYDITLNDTFDMSLECGDE